MPNKYKQLVLSDAAETAAERNRPVFIDTTLGTCLGMMLSLNDTVSDFKRKIEKEHTLSFSNIGDIVVHSLKVKRRGQFYHLSDSLLVKEAFGFVSKNWFLSVDASIAEKKRDQRQENAHNLDRFELPLDDDQSKRRECEIGIIEKSKDLLEEASQLNPASKKKRKRETKRNVPSGDLREENIGSGRDTSAEPAVISHPALGDKARDGSDTRKSKKRKTSKSKLDRVSDGVPYSEKDFGKNNPNGELNGKTPSESGEISTKQKNPNTTQEVGDQELLAVDTLHKTDKNEEEKEFALDKMKTLEDRLPVDVESNTSLVIKEPEDLEMSFGVSGHKDIGISPQAERPEEQSKKSDSDNKQSNDLDSTFGAEIEANTKALDFAAGLVDENRSVVPTNTGKKSKKQRKKTKGLDENVVTKSGEPDVRGSGTKVSAEPLGAKCNGQGDENARNDESKSPPTNVNEVVQIENNGNEVREERIEENEPVKRKSKKKQKSVKNPRGVQVEEEDVLSENPTLPTVTVNEAVVSSKTKKKGKMGKLELANFGVQLESVADDPKSVTDKSTEADRGDKESIDKADLTYDIRRGSDETEAKTSAPNKIETSKGHLPIDVASNRPLAMKQTEDLQTDILEQGALSKNDDDTRKIQSNDQTEVKANDVDSTAVDLVSENVSVDVPTDTGKKRKKSKKTTGLDKKLLAQSGERVAETTVSVESLGDKSDLIPNVLNVEEEPMKTKSRKKKKSSAKNLPDAQVEPKSERKDKVQNDTVVAEPKQVISKSTEAKLHSLDHGEKESSDEANRANNQLEVYGMSNKITLAKPLPNIAPSSEVLVAEKVPKTKTDSVQTSSNAQSSPKSNGKQGITGKTPAVNPITVPGQESLLLEEKSDESTVHRVKKPTKASNKSAKAPPSDVSSKKRNVVNGSSNVTASQSAVTNKGQSDVVSYFASTNSKIPFKSLEPKKRLVSTPGSIFKDGSDESSSDDEGSDDSNASTRTPSDYSSDYSDGDEKGTKSVDKRSILKSCASAGKDYTFDSIIRSSSRYKKAIVIASESQLNDESQQVDFVPDSQPIQ